MGLSASEPKLASQVGNPAKNGKARKLDNLRRFGRKRSCSGRRIYLGKALIISHEGVRKGGTSRDARPNEVVRAADESIVVMNLAPRNAGNGREGKTQGTCPEGGHGGRGPKARE